MAQLYTRDDFKAYCLKRLGAPIITINVTDDQVEDRIDDALEMYHDYHYDGSEKVYIGFQVTADMANSQSITMPEGISGVTGIFQLGGITNGENIFDYRYQVALNDLYTLISQSLVPYYVTMEHLQFLENLFVGQKPIRFNRRTGILHIDADWTEFDIGMYIIVEATQIVNPEVYSSVWNDRWLKAYTTALIRVQWGNVLGKFANIQMPGGVTFNGQQILEMGMQEKADLEEKLRHDLTMPFLMQTG